MLGLPFLVLSLLLFGACLLGVALGNHFPLLSSLVSLLAGGSLIAARPRRVMWVGSLFGILIFLSGTPLTGAPSACLLISAVAAIYYIGWAHLIAGSRDSTRSFAENNTVTPQSLFTIAFYATLLLVFLLLKHDLFPFPRLIGIAIAVIFLLLSLSLWEMSRRSRLTQVGQVDAASMPDLVGRVLVLLAIALATFLLFRLPLPWMAQGTLAVAEEMGLTAPEPNQRPTRPETPPGGGDLDPTRPPSEQGPDLDAGSPNQHPGDPGEVAGNWRRGSLPKTADLDLDEMARFHMRVVDEQQEQRLLGKPIYMRSHTMGLYEEGEWKRRPRVGDLISDVEDGNTDGWIAFGTVSEERAIGHTIFQYNYVRGAPILTMPNVHAIELPRIFKQSDDFFTIQKMGDISYRAISSPVTYDDLAGGPPLAVCQTEPMYTEQARGMVFRDMRNFLLDPTEKSHNTLKYKLAFLRKWFQENTEYSLKVENSGSYDPLANFLFHERRGYCDFYAQAGAHMARGLGIPSRVAYGYTGGLYDPKQRLYTFRGKDAHAWTEIMLKGHGWVIFDLVPIGSGARRPAQLATSKSASGVNNPLRRFKEAEALARKQQREPELRAPKPSLAKDLEDWFKAAWNTEYLDWVLGITIIGLLGSFLWRRWRSRGEDDDLEAALAAKRRKGKPGYIRDFCELFAKHGQERAEGQTLRDYMRHLKRTQMIKDEFDGLLDYHYAVEYEEGTRKKDQEKSFQRAIREFKKRLS